MVQKKPKIKAVIFDLGGVVMHGGYLPFVQHFCKACLTKEGKKRLAYLEREVNLGNISELKFYRELQRVFNVHLTPKQMHKEIVKRMKTDKRLVQLIPQLKKTKVALFSNSIGNMAVEVLRKRHLPVDKLFDQIFISSRMHVAKPDSDAYREILRKLKVKPHEALMVDDRQVNIRGAKKLGMQGILYKNSAQLRKAIAKYDLI